MSKELVGSSLLCGFDKLRQEELLLDFTIRVGEREFKAHKQLLAASSAYFKAMFSYDTIENREMTATLKDLEPDVMEAVLEFCYTGELNLTDANATELLFAASRLQIELLQEACAEFIKRSIDNENCLTILQLSDRINLDTLTKVSLECCGENFKSILSSQEFLTLDKLSLERIIRDDRLAVQDESLVLEAVIKWVEHEADRDRHLDDLLRLVRFALFDSATLMEASSIDLLQASSIGPRLVETAKNLILSKDHPASSRVPELIGSGLITRPRVRMPDFYMICVLLQKYAALQKYHHRSRKWSGVADINLERVGFGCVVLNDHIYLIGGRKKHSAMKSCIRLNLNEPKTWLGDVPPLKEPRHKLRAVEFEGFIYALGGYESSNSYTGMVEKYDPGTKQWSVWFPFKQPRHSFGAVVHKGRIYIAGGCDPPLKSVQRSVGASGWEDVPDMMIGRKNFSLCSCQGTLYAVGGTTGINNSPTTVSEYYDEKSNTWLPTSDMRHNHRATEAIAVGGIIYAIELPIAYNWYYRPFYASESLVESYNPATGAWTIEPNCRTGTEFLALALGGL